MFEVLVFPVVVRVFLTRNICEYKKRGGGTIGRKLEKWSNMVGLKKSVQVIALCLTATPPLSPTMSHSLLRALRTKLFFLSFPVLDSGGGEDQFAGILVIVLIRKIVKMV